MIAPPRLHDSGQGPAVLLLHAFPQDASQWDAQVALLSAGHRCLRPDAYGCGASPPPPPGLTLDAVAGAVLAALDAAGVDRFAVCGLSMGGYTALALWRRAPERIATMVLADTRPQADTDAARQDRLAMARTLRRDGVEAIVDPMSERLLAAASLREAHVADAVRGRIRRCTPEGLAACQEAMASRPDHGDALGGIDVPVLVLVGSEDAVTPPEVARQLAAAIPGATLEVLDGAGHLSNVERPAEFGTLVGDFLAGVPAW